MKRKIIVLISSFLISINFVFAKKDKIILTIGDHAITKSEFERIYKKNNTSTVYDNKSVEEYLELFINYKLKVLEAERLGYDTASSFLEELHGYREKLVEPYLDDEEVLETFIQKGIERSKTEVSVSHIMVRVDNRASQDDTLKAYNKIVEIRERIVNGEPFDSVAIETSEDRSVKSNAGQLKWFSAFRMVYPFEDAAFTTPIGEVSMPFRTKFGYHIIIVHGFRPAKGHIKMAHILVRNTDEPNAEVTNPRARIDKYYKMIKNGEDFAEVARNYSDDKYTAKHGGELKWIQSGILPDDLDSIVFCLRDSGDITEPLQTEHGWHIFQLLEKKPVGSDEELRPQATKSLKRSDIKKVIDKVTVKKILSENNFVEYKDNLDTIRNIIDSSIYAGEWDIAIANNMIEPIFKIDNMEFTQKDFARFIAKEKYSIRYSFDYIVHLKYNEFVDYCAFEFKKSTLEDKYPELRYLMQEYHDGILLFNLTDDIVWSKATKDSVGLVEFFKDKCKGKYMWQKRVDASIYKLSDSSLVEKAKELALMRARKELSKEDLINKLCPVDSIECVEIEDNLFEEKDNELVDKITWEKYASGTFKVEDKTLLVVVNDLVEPEPKLLSEVRGLVTADYQTYLEKKWIEELRNKYAIEVNNKVLKKVK